MTRFKLALLAGVALAPLAAVPHAALAQSVTLPAVDVVADPPAPVAAPSVEAPSAAEMATVRASTPDAARLFTPVPGVAFQTGGGVSSLPVVRGFADDRNKVLVGGADIASACANHMNPALSYISTPLAASAEVISGAVPVSRGGDSIGSTIVVKPAAPIFAQQATQMAAPALPGAVSAPLPTRKAAVDDGGVLRVAGSLSAFFRSADKGVTLAGSASVATRHFSLSYAGSWARGSDYRPGGGGRVLSTNYRAENHAATLAYQNDGQTLTARFAAQSIPYQGFVNQRMDMLGNEGRTASLGYEGRFGWGKIEADAYWHSTKHYMNFLTDKGGSTPATGMPMHTDGKDFGANVKAEIALSQRDTLRVGALYHAQRLDDWWPPVKGMMTTMCCDTFWNINNGHRDRIGAYAEWNAKWTPEWTSEVGARIENVRMSAGTVQGYSPVNVGRNMMGMMSTVNYLGDATAFNAADRTKSDVNVDATATLRYQPSKAATFELGLARKVRSPNLYERYAWSKGSPTFGMSPNMVNWVGDGNGYVGDINLKPEAAHTVSATMILRDPVSDRWEMKLSPYASYVSNFIDADRLWRQMSGMKATPFYTLQFANHDARLFGVDWSGRARLLDHADYGAFSIAGSLGYVNGKNVDTGDHLYNIMPLRGRASLEHRIRLGGGDLTTTFEVEAAQGKTKVNLTRNELKTPGYALANVRAAYEWRNLRFDIGVENVFDKRYALPLGGVNMTDYRKSGAFGPVLGMGRSVYGGATLKF
jgi:iron complex outermembrane receptor protein